jgi:hypothetical protein
MTLYLSPNALFSGRIFYPLLDILKASFQQFIVILGETDLVRLFKRIKKFM